jgi:hypothetical protein
LRAARRKSATINTYYDHDEAVKTRILVADAGILLQSVGVDFLSFSPRAIAPKENYAET